MVRSKLASLLDQRRRLRRFEVNGRYRINGSSTFFAIGSRLSRELHRSDNSLDGTIRWWYLKLSAHVITRDWAALLAFSKSKRSPIGYEPFVIALIAAGAPKEAKEYVSRCDSAKRVELFVRCGDWIAAGRECVRKGSRDELLELNSRCPNSILAAQLDQLVESMAS